MQLRKDNVISKEKNDRMKEAVSEVKRYTDRLRGEGKDPTVYIMTFGCQQNEADSERFAGLAESMGYTVSDSPEGAYLVLVNTCAIREHAEKKALSCIGQLKHNKSRNPEMIIGVGGCMVSQQHRADTLKKSYPYVDFSFTTTELYRIPELILARISGGRRNFPSVEVSLCDTSFSEDVPVHRASRSRAWVSIMYGCNNFCSYCIVPYVRGRERSRLPEDIEREVRELASDGCRDITLLGQNVNSYGHDLMCGTDFAQLLSRLAKIEGDFRIRFMTSHPKDATSELISVMAENEKIARHFHLPMQSGSDRILKAMNRRYDTEKYFGIVEEIRRKMPDAAITSDIIVGFPGETEEDFEETLSMLRRVKFDMIYAFIYSPRKGTPAAEREDQIPEEIKKARFARLTELQNEISKEKNEPFIGRTLKVLANDGENVSEGRTDGNKLIRFSPAVCGGGFINVKVTDADTFGLSGEVIF